MFDKFYNHLRMDATLIAETGIYIGAGEDSFQPTDINGSILRDANGKPYIPGSSLKGVLRAFFASALDEPIVSKIIDELGDKGKRDKWKAVNNGGDPELVQYIEDHSTLTERLFGSQLMAGKVKLSDAIPKADVPKDYRTSNAIDRETHTVAKESHALFTTETIPAGAAFSFRLDAENLTRDEADYLLQLLDEMERGSIIVGGRSRAGLGRVRLENRTYAIRNRVEGSFPKTQDVERAGVLSALMYPPEKQEAAHV